MRKNRGITLETINDEADTTQEEAMKKRKLRLTIERFVMLVMMMKINEWDFLCGLQSF